jgi:ketosteroid isomerase-like protein
MKLSDPGIRELVIAYEDSIKTKNIDKYIDLYSDDALIFDMWDIGCYAGKKEWKDMNQKWFDSLNENKVIVDFVDLQYQIVNNNAFLFAFVNYKEVDIHDLELRRLKNRLTWVCIRKTKKWIIKHQHTSVPIDSKSIKGMFDFLY